MKTPKSFRGKRKQKVSVYEKERPILREMKTAYNPLAGIAEQYTLQSITPLFSCSPMFAYYWRLVHQAQLPLMIYHLTGVIRHLSSILDTCHK